MNSSTKRSVLTLDKIIFKFLIIAILFSNYNKCDLPVHCKREEIEGVWTFRINKYTFNANLNNAKTSCGHGFPDQVEKTVGDINFNFESYIDVELNLASDYKIYAKNSNRVVGHWTPVYDEAFIAYYKNSVFTAFMKYYKKEESGYRAVFYTSETSGSTAESSKPDSNYQSNCDKTMIGWYIPNSNQNDKNWSCFFGFKSKIRNEFTPNTYRFLSNKNEKDRKVYSAEPNESNFMEMSTNSQTYTNAGLHMMKYDQEDLVNELNSMNLSWKADIHDEFRGLSFFELKEKLGLKREKIINPRSVNNFPDDLNLNIFDSSNQPQVETINSSDNILESVDNMSSVTSGISMNTNIITNINSNFNSKAETTYSSVEEDSYKVTDYSIVSKYMDKELGDIDVNKLPKNWDWRNVGGVNYIPSPRRQLNCGSCYVFSLISSLESRLRILTNNQDQTSFSRQFPLACSFYTEGCNGGYPLLVAKFLNEFEVIPESCASYNPSDVDCRKMCDYTKFPIKYYVSKYEYLGGFYGATNEIDLIKEIRARGPIPGNMSVPWTFSYYKNGIFSQNATKKNSGNFSKTTLFDKNLSWSSVDHSILLVGYGEENGIKYWIGMNTWGTNWGENGFFKLLRGENDCNIETMGDAARISFKARDR